MTLPTNDLPEYLQQFIAYQDDSQYTDIDHACWRYIMRVSKAYFKDHAHPKYLEGLEETGITTERIPRVSEMDQKLKKFGWRAIAITGFIPSEAFMEMLSLSIMPIACDMRKLEHIDYTPAPDIVHEAAGHAPIVADKDYASYLHKFGEIARRVIFAKEDNDVYKAVLHLSETKADPHASKEEISRAQKNLDEVLTKVTYASEAQKLTRLGWWTIEYGLFKKNDEYLIYGAGLLSSVWESYNCLSSQIKKVPLTIECTNVAFDITKPQPQLFYTDDFKKLENVIDQLASTMAYKRGGGYGLSVAKKAETVTATELDSGLQIGGIVQDYKMNDKNEIIFIKYKGAAQLAYKEKQLEGHGPQYHKEGFSTPIGRIKGFNKPASMLTMNDIKSFSEIFEFESGITVKGKLKSVLQKEGKTLVITFTNCTVEYKNEILFRPEWGNFDLACGEKVISVFGGAPDRAKYAEESQSVLFQPRKQKINKTKDNEKLIPLYSQIRSIRELQHWRSAIEKELENVAQILQQEYPNDWLLRIEIMELLANYKKNNTLLYQTLKKDVLKISQKASHLKMLVDRGLDLIEG